MISNWAKAMETALETALEDILTHTHKAEMIAYIKSSTDAIDEAFELAESDSQPYTWRSSAQCIWKRHRPLPYIKRHSYSESGNCQRKLIDK
jgi:hypothetical protein